MTLGRKPYKEGGLSTLRRSRLGTKRTADPVTRRVHGMTMNRAGGRCEVRHERVCGGRLQWHHRKQVQHLGRSVVENGLIACAGCHAFVHGHPRLSRERGWLLHSTDEPSQVPVTLWDGRRVLLTPAGAYEEVVT